MLLFEKVNREEQLAIKTIFDDHNERCLIHFCSNIYHATKEQSRSREQTSTCIRVLILLRHLYPDIVAEEKSFFIKLHSIICLGT